MSYEELIELYKNVLADQYVIDVNKMPVAFLAKKAQKFAENYKLPDIRGRFRYLNCIRDAIQNPYELWLNPDNKRLYYIKKYDKNVVLIVEIDSKNQLEYFNILVKSGNILNKYRQGALLYKI